MSGQTTTAEKVRKLPWVAGANAANSVFCSLTVFGSVFMLFLGRMGLPKTRIGILLALFPFSSCIALLVAPAVRRFGFKRSFLVFWTARKFVAAALLAVPFVLARFGVDAAFYFVAGILLMFAVCRAVAETGWYPWVREYVPDSIRGKFGALSSIGSTLVTMGAVSLASFVIGRSEGFVGFQLLIALGVIAGLVSVWCHSHVPGGAPQPRQDREPAFFRSILDTLKDRNFTTFLGGVALAALAVGPLQRFFFLFMKEQAGLPENSVVKLELFMMLGTTLTIYLWGWAADRFGSKPVMLCGLVGLILAVCLLAVFPWSGEAARPAAIGVAAFLGFASAGWGMGHTRHLYVHIIPEERNTEYTAIFSATMGLVGGLAPIAAGRILDACEGMSGAWLSIPVHPYTLFFLAGALCLAAGAVAMGRVRRDGDVATGRFVLMFLQGNPVRAIWSSVQWYRASRETDRVVTAENLGTSRSSLNEEELLEALSDPSFNVRYEAIISIARTRPSPRLVAALVAILEGEEAELSVAAAWALSRMNAQEGIAPLRRAMSSRYPLLRARSARALAMLGDREVVPEMLSRFQQGREEERIAFAAALGALQATEATADLLAYLQTIDNATLRTDLLMALARLIDQERRFLRLWRNSSTNFGSAASQTLATIRKRAARPDGLNGTLDRAFDAAARAIEKEDVPAAAEAVAALIRALALPGRESPTGAILDVCCQELESRPNRRKQLILLALCALAAAMKPKSAAPASRGGNA